jgi:hypothetical protein
MHVFPWPETMLGVARLALECCLKQAHCQGPLVFPFRSIFHVLKRWMWSTQSVSYVSGDGTTEDILHFEKMLWVVAYCSHVVTIIFPMWNLEIYSPWSLWLFSGFRSMATHSWAFDSSELWNQDGLGSDRAIMRYQGHWVSGVAWRTSSIPGQLSSGVLRGFLEAHLNVFHFPPPWLLSVLIFFFFFAILGIKLKGSTY